MQSPAGRKGSLKPTRQSSRIESPRSSTIGILPASDSPESLIDSNAWEPVMMKRPLSSLESHAILMLRKVSGASRTSSKTTGGLKSLKSSCASPPTAVNAIMPSKETRSQSGNVFASIVGLPTCLAPAASTHFACLALSANALDNALSKYAMWTFQVHILNLPKHSSICSAVRNQSERHSLQHQ